MDIEQIEHRELEYMETCRFVGSIILGLIVTALVVFGPALVERML